MGRNQHAVKCLECDQVYSARLHNGDVLLPTNKGVCKCGATQVVDMTVGEVRDIHATVIDQDDGERNHDN